MIDNHFDLLTIAYISYLKNDYTYLEKIKYYFNKNNVIGVIANLYFMSIEEMREELDINYYNPFVSVVNMFKISKNILEEYLPNTNILYSIEGCDYVNIEDLEKLYSLGLRSIILVWNNKNKYGSGNRSDIGLTKLGKEFIKKAIDLNIGIDLSHANEKTFNDIIDIIKSYEKKVICYASHSNSRKLCDNKRNLTDEQLYKIKEVNGLVGVVSYKKFIGNNTYLDHIIHIESIVGIDNVILSSDDMSFYNYLGHYNNNQLFDYSNICKNILRILLLQYDLEKCYNILRRNSEKFFNELRR